MITPKRFALRLILAIVPLCLTSSLWSDGYVRLESPAGEAIEAEIISVSGDDVTLRRRGASQTVQTRMEHFSAASQTRIQVWSQVQAMKRGCEFAITTEFGDKTSGTTDAMEWEASEAGYRLSVTNKTGSAIRGLTARYTIVVKREELERQHALDHRLEYETGLARFPLIPPGETVRVNTAMLGLREEKKLGSGATVTHNAILSAKDSLQGIVIRFEYKGRTVYSEAKPKAVLQQLGPIGRIGWEQELQAE